MPESKTPMGWLHIEFMNDKPFSPLAVSYNTAF